jgi:hypothetical protein
MIVAVERFAISEQSRRDDLISPLWGFKNILYYYYYYNNAIPSGLKIQKTYLLLKIGIYL